MYTANSLLGKLKFGCINKSHRLQVCCFNLAQSITLLFWKLVGFNNIKATFFQCCLHKLQG